ncbi:plasmid replication protein RepC [Teichococcus rhizosphaerae]|uniref:plasmid replication protein RepC n=1 Tax=Teichococcus rhizosphaerae TaxID=1335062 RepID=UPI00159BEBA5|nr:plasmid replication protein RepC [Pseudoroseomonas rhizosphaerae]
MEALAFPRGASCGLRKLTVNHLAAARLAGRAQGLPPGVRHPNQLLAALRRAAPHLGCTRLLPLMETLFRWTQPQDWAPDAAPIVWPSNEALALALDCSERHVSRLIAAAIEARLLTARDGTDRKRRGLRQEGRILWAWGLDLRPMAARHAEFVAAAEAGERARRHCSALRREGARARQALAQLLALAQDRQIPAAPLAAKLEEARRLTAPLGRAEDPARLEAAIGAARLLVAEATSWLEQAVESADMSGLGDADVRSNIPTESPHEPEGITVAAPGRGRLAEKAAPPLPRQVSAAEAVVPEAPRLHPAELARLAPRLGEQVLSPRPGWGEISEAALALARRLGIPATLYGEACQVLGRPGAAVAIGIISTKPEGHFHSAGPGGYLRGMLRRAREGGLFLERSLFGLREKAARDGRLTAVNSHLPFGPASPVAGKMRDCPSSALTAAFAS